MRLLAIPMAVALAGCVSHATITSSSAHGSALPAGPATLPEGQIVGDARVFDNLTIFPLTAERQKDVGPLTTLGDALAKKEAVVREVEVENLHLRQRIGDDGEIDETSSGGPRVNELVIENHGLVALYVLAGTVVEGGNQDREIAQDFIVAPNQTVSVEAFCVENGRWTDERAGQRTNGRFGAAPALATGRVRAAAQYEHNQDEVWSNVAEVNAAQGKHSDSGSLAATLDDEGIAKKRAELGARVDAYLQGPSSGNIVGIAYAIGGEVRAVRFFANHRVWDMFRATLVSTAAGEAVTVSTDPPQAGRREHPTALSEPKAKDAVLLPVAVARFVTGVDDTAMKEERKTTGRSVNDYRETSLAYGSHTMMKANGDEARPSMVSADYLHK